MNKKKILEENNEQNCINDNNNKDDIKTFKYTRLLFFLLGVSTIMSKKKLTNREKYFSIVLLILSQFFLLFVLFPAFYHILFCEQDMRMIIALLGPVGVGLISFFKYLAIIYRRNNIINLIKQVEIDWRMFKNKSDKNIMENQVKVGENITIFMAIFMYVGGISHQIVSPFLPGTPIALLVNSSSRPLVYPVYNNIFDSQSSPTYELIYLSHILMAAVVCTMTVTSCNLGAIFVTHLCGQIRITVTKLKNLITDENYSTQVINSKMATVIRLHNKIIKFSINLEQVLSEVCLIEVFGSTVIICLDEYYCLMVLRYNEIFGFSIYFVLLIAFIFNVFIICHIGELLKNEYIKAGQSIYSIDWYKLPSKSSKKLILIILMIQSPRRISAGGLMELSYNGFTLVLKTSLTFLNLLRMVD